MNPFDFQTPPYICDLMVSLVPCGVNKVLEPTPGLGNLVSALSRYDVTAPANFWDVSGRYDAVVMNPPFSPMREGYRILSRCLELSDCVIALMPWLTIINSVKRTSDICDFGLVSVIHLPRNVFAGARVQCCILQMSRGFTGITQFKAPAFGVAKTHYGSLQNSVQQPKVCNAQSGTATV